MVDTCNVIKIPANWNVCREPTRPVELRRDYFGGMKFDENYDWNLLWYDAIHTNNSVLLVGPPLNNLVKQLVSDPLVTVDGQPLQYSHYTADRMCLTVVNSPNDQIRFKSGDQIQLSKVSTQLDNTICMFTLQKNNPISWIQQWIKYHATLGVESFLIYDNASDLYSASELETALNSLGVFVKVVEWAVPYGPQGFDCEYYNTWDSDYAQSCMFEHAKHRYLTNARLAINADIDELLVLNTSIENIILDIERSQIAGYKYLGRWIEPYDVVNKTSAAAVPMNQRQFKSYYCTDSSNPYGIGNKWMLIPRLSLNSQWSVHSTTAKMEQNNSIYYAHYLAMNTNWSWGRDQYSRDINNLVADIKLMHNLSKIRG